ncbi:MAG: T9SS type A sorting domain-containing protein [Bacteroidota bacterium]
MIKNLRFFVFAYILFSSVLMGQDDNVQLQDDNYTNTYWLNTVPFYDLPDIKVGEYYNHRLEIRIPKDTITSMSGRLTKVKIEKLRIVGVNNVPRGLSYSPSVVDNSDENYYRLYLELYGRIARVSSSNIDIEINTTFSIDSGKSLVRRYEIKNISIREDTNIDLETSSDKIGLKALEYYPNPISNKTEVRFWSSKLQLVEFEVRDAIGNLKFKKTFTAKVGSNKVSFSQKDLRNGLYLYSIKNDDQILAKRLIIK